MNRMNPDRLFLYPSYFFERFFIYLFIFFIVFEGGGGGVQNFFNVTFSHLPARKCTPPIPMKLGDLSSSSANSGQSEKDDDYNNDVDSEDDDCNEDDDDVTTKGKRGKTLNKK